MTKGQLIKTLEPFDDDIEIVINMRQNYGSSIINPSVWYHFTKNDDYASIVLTNPSNTIEEAVELKIK